MLGLQTGAYISSPRFEVTFLLFLSGNKTLGNDEAVIGGGSDGTKLGSKEGSCRETGEDCIAGRDTTTSGIRLLPVLLFLFEMPPFHPRKSTHSQYGYIWLQTVAVIPLQECTELMIFLSNGNNV
jgi:hypothetical protein